MIPAYLFARLWHTPAMAADTWYGFPKRDWAAAKEQARTALIACARERATTTYSGLCEDVTAIRLRPYTFAMMAFLNEICTEEDAAHGVMLASLVTRKDSGLPGDGYFRNAARLGRDVSDHRAFWESEVERIYSVWG